MTKYTVSEHIKKIRGGKGWNQEKLAEESGLTQSIIGKMERGKSLTIDNILRVVNALDASLDEVFGRNGFSRVSEPDIEYESKSAKESHLLEKLEIKEQIIKQQDREIITYKTFLDQKDKLIEMLNNRIKELEGH